MKLYELICFNNITHIYISPAVSNRRHYILDDIKLINYESTTDNALFFGMYDSVDYYKFKNHQGKKWIFWCGTDTDITNKSRLKHITNLISINKINGHMCKEIIVYNTLVKLDLNPTFINSNPCYKLVSIILPTLNRLDGFKNVVNQILNQTYTHFELIIIDDGSDKDILIKKEEFINSINNNKI